MNNLIVNWDAVVEDEFDRPANIINYRIFNFDSQIAEVGNVTSHTFPDVNPENSFSISVSAVNSAGEGPRSEVFVIAPAPPPQGLPKQVGGVVGIILIASPPPPPPPTAWVPGGANVWAWAWTGDGGENCTLIPESSRQRISAMSDLSGNGNDYFNNNSVNRPYYEETLSVGAYSTTYAPIFRHRWNDGENVYDQWLDQTSTMAATGEFYLATCGLNTRSAGVRILWGRDEDNKIGYDQGADTVYGAVAGGSFSTISADGALPEDEFLLEVWRDSSNDIHVWANGVDISRSPKRNYSGTFDMGGLGWDQGGSDFVDDYVFEYVATKGSISAVEKAETREYLRAKWNLYTNPNALTEFTLEEG